MSSLTSKKYLEWISTQNIEYLNTRKNKKPLLCDICSKNGKEIRFLKTNGNCPLCRKVLIEEEEETHRVETKEDVENTGTSIDFNFYNTQVNGGPVGGGTSIDFYTSGNTQIQRIISKMKY